MNIKRTRRSRSCGKLGTIASSQVVLLGLLRTTICRSLIITGCGFVGVWGPGRLNLGHCPLRWSHCITSVHASFTRSSDAGENTLHHPLFPFSLFNTCNCAPYAQDDDVRPKRSSFRPLPSLSTMSSLHPTTPYFSIAAAVGTVLVLIPLPWHIEAMNTGTCYYMIWTALACLNQLVNSIVWAGNVNNPAPVWCDICEYSASSLSCLSGIADQVQSNTHNHWGICRYPCLRPLHQHTTIQDRSWSLCADDECRGTLFLSDLWCPSVLILLSETTRRPH